MHCSKTMSHHCKHELPWTSKGANLLSLKPDNTPQGVLHGFQNESQTNVVALRFPGRCKKKKTKMVRIWRLPRAGNHPRARLRGEACAGTRVCGPASRRKYTKQFKNTATMRQAANNRTQRARMASLSTVPETTCGNACSADHQDTGHWTTQFYNLANCQKP